MTTKRNFVSVDKEGKSKEPLRIFGGREPRQAALKAANRGMKDIRLRERGTKKVHVFKGWRKQVKAPQGSPDWLPPKINKPFVKKLGVEKI